MNEALNRLSLLKRHNGTDAVELDAVYESIKNDQRFREFYVQYSILFCEFSDKKAFFLSVRGTCG